MTSGPPPLVGITAGNDPKVPEHYILRWDYVHAVAAAGGVPVILAPSPAAERTAFVEPLSAIVLSGGMDVSPELYGARRSTAVTVTSIERDLFEQRLVLEALTSGLPVLAICRGMQLLNVVLGGTLVQHLPDSVDVTLSHDDPHRSRHTLAHDVEVAAGSLLAVISGAERFPVNSFHHQGIDRLGDGLTPVAWSDDGVIEAVARSDGSWVLGVQWHPEALWKLGSPYLALFEALVEAATERALTSPS